MSDGHSDFVLQVLCLDVTDREVYPGDTVWYSDSWGNLKKSRALGTGYSHQGGPAFCMSLFGYTPYLLLQDDAKIELPSIGGRSPRILRENS